ncbi:D-alanyl-D-alanine carboxypeptidase [Virgibacillus sp. AGTR]|uniref:D-alanyl-D-alanine carboxypeptidase family protein n=1 Tax=Virgibacillus sp. AGTR TaxID=2812055 RepID=UPI0019627BD3|nr:D-alanyl-D-alanine carboxypeptidase family protein [Virgibacillus sp. AGTR]MCC2249136.1 D-alanyl-D-alanine carboxypeptidase [Virgibacillus sp. AGTR]QRZ16956.1 D-alanyl-D-alanine carboxypeptidase [Virgibacillus sp. AGTR]
MKRGLLVVSMVITLLIHLSSPVFAEETGSDTEKLAENTKSAILMERDTGEVLFDKNAHEKLPPASMTKIMTLLLIMEALDEGKLKLDETVRVSDRAASMGGSQIFLESGEEMSVQDLLKGVAVASGNDASVALAERIAGSEKAFVKKMNDKVKELDLKDTKFQNATGLPAEDHYSTSYDMSIMAKELLKYESITDYTSIYEDYLRKGQDNEFWLVNTNKLVKFYPGVDGLKTGYTNEAKYCLTATAEKEEMRVIAVVMGAKTTKERNAAVSGMLDFAFNHYQTNKLFEKGDKITDLKLLKADKTITDVVASESISTLHKKGESMDDIATEVNVHHALSLPIFRGDKVGELIVKNGDEIISRTDLTIKETIDEASYFTLLKRTLQRIAKNE